MAETVESVVAAAFLRQQAGRRVRARLRVPRPLWADRHHDRALKTPREVWDALVDVLQCGRKRAVHERPGTG